MLELHHREVDFNGRLSICIFDEARDRGRNAGYPAPPAQIRT